MELSRKLHKMKQPNLDIKYLISLPKKYHSNTKWLWPMILYLHGTMTKTNDIDKLKSNGLPKVVSEMEDFPFITVSPLCPFGKIWSDLFDEIKEIILFLRKEYRISDIYLTGYDMGGHGVWTLASFYPEHFSAIAPVCSDPIQKEKIDSIVSSLINVSILVYHGRRDRIVPFQEAMEIPEKIREEGGDVNIKLFDNMGHNCCIRTYTDPELYEWLISHHKR